MSFMYSDLANMEASMFSPITYVKFAEVGNGSITTRIITAYKASQTQHNAAFG